MDGSTSSCVEKQCDSEMDESFDRAECADRIEAMLSTAIMQHEDIWNLLMLSVSEGLSYDAPNTSDNWVDVRITPEHFLIINGSWKTPSTGALWLKKGSTTFVPLLQTPTVRKSHAVNSTLQTRIPQDDRRNHWLSRHFQGMCLMRSGSQHENERMRPMRRESSWCSNQSQQQI